MKEIKCEICGIECKTFKGIARHILKSHKIKSKDYYDKYLKQYESDGVCPECGKETKFKSISIGYREYCSSK